MSKFVKISFNEKNFWQVLEKNQVGRKMENSKAEQLFYKALQNTGKAQAEMVEQAKKDYEEAQKQSQNLFPSNTFLWGKFG